MGRQPDAPLLTAKQLRHFKRVHPPKKINVRLIRQKTQTSQEEF